MEELELTYQVEPLGHRDGKKQAGRQRRCIGSQLTL